MISINGNIKGELDGFIKRSILLVSCCLLLLSTTNSQAQQYHFTKYGLSEGLAQSQVFSMLEDSRGYIWMGTNGGGLSCFDGLEFKTYTLKDSLPSNYILSLYEDVDGLLWIGTSKGVVIYDGEKFTDLKLWNRKVSVNAINKVKGLGWMFGTDKGVFVMADSIPQKLRPDDYPNQGNIEFIEEDTKGKLWIGSNTGLTSIENGQIKRYGRKEGLVSKLVLCFKEDREGNIWIGSYGGGINRLEGNRIKNHRGIPELKDAIINDILIDDGGALWIATLNKGVCRYNPKDSSYSFLNEKDGLPNNHVECLLRDSWGNYWMGTSGGGSCKYSGQQFEYYSKNQGLNGSYIFSVIRANDNQLWLGSSGGGISTLTNGHFNHYKADSGFSNVKVKALLWSKDSLLWIGTEGEGVAVFTGDTFYSYTTKEGLGGNWIKSLAEDKKGNIWAGSAGGGITKISKQDSSGVLLFKKYKTGKGLVSNRIIHLHIDSLDRVWYASRSGGLGYIQDSLIQNFTIEEGLNSNTVRSLTEDSFGNLWIGTNQGINRVALYSDSLKVDKLEGNSLISNNIYLLKADPKNHLWVGTEKGVGKLTIDGEAKVVEVVHFGKDDGFTGVETNLNAVYAEPSGDIWFGTVNGLHKYLSEVSIKNEKAPILNFKSITLNYKPLHETAYSLPQKAGESINFEYDENNLIFDFIGVTQTFPKKVKYKWRLKGLDENWSPENQRTSASFFNLGAGEYQLEILSANENDVWNREPIIFPFSIRLPIWKESWFIISYTVLGVLILLLIIGSRIRFVKRNSKRKQEKLEMERDAIALEQKALRLQMNPHFIFHTLNSIQALIASKEEKVAREYLSKFSRLMRQILENSRVNEITLDAELEAMENYLTIEQFCHENKFHFSIEVEEGMEVEFIKIPPMIIQPFLENSIIHGLGNQEKQGQLKLSFKDKGSILWCEIEDNGIGREKAAELKSVSNRSHKSTALEVTTERLELLSQEQDSIQIIDLKDENGEALGTKVILKIPISE